MFSLLAGETSRKTKENTSLKYSFLHKATFIQILGIINSEKGNTLLLQKLNIPVCS